VGSTRPDGSPHAAPVWGLWLGDGVYFGTSPSSSKGRNLAGDRRCVVHLESGDEVVIIEGEVEEVALDERLADAYEAKYDYRPDPAASEGPGWYRLRPWIAYAWTEREFPRSATRFAFSDGKGAGEEDRPGAAAPS
jgi:Pyridoxamine 5'-phosphate oxidase